jgi:hypothetical protein
MKAIEFEATASQHTIRVPDQVPEGVAVRVLILFDEAKTGANAGQHWKTLLTAMPDVGSDEDFSRPLDYGREQSWDS